MSIVQDNLKLLAIESSGNVASVAILEQEKIIAELTINTKKTHSTTLLPMIDQMIKMCEKEKNLTFLIKKCHYCYEI